MKRREFIKGFGGAGGVVALNELCPGFEGEEFKDITANTLTIGPEDVLVLFTTRSVTEKDLRAMRFISKRLPCRDVLVLGQGMKVGVLRTGGD